MHITRVVLSFDDGRKDNYAAAMEILERKKLPATFNITSGYIEKSIPLDELCQNEPMSIDEVVELSKIPFFEIAGHGYAHLNTFDDWHKGVEQLKLWLEPDYFKNGYGVASPHSIVTDSWIASRKDKLLNSEIKYIRTGLKNQFQFAQRAISKASRLTGSKYLAYLPIEDSLRQLNGPQELYYSIPILNAHSFEQIKYIINMTVKRQGDVIFMLHSVLKSGKDYYDDLYSWDYDRFLKLCTYLYEMQSQGNLEVKKNIDLI